MPGGGPLCGTPSRRGRPSARRDGCTRGSAARRGSRAAAAAAAMGRPRRAAVRLRLDVAGAPTAATGLVRHDRRPAPTSAATTCAGTGQLPRRGARLRDGGRCPEPDGCRPGWRLVADWRRRGRGRLTGRRMDGATAGAGPDGVGPAGADRTRGSPADAGTGDRRAADDVPPGLASPRACPWRHRPMARLMACPTACARMAPSTASRARQGARR